MVYPLAQFSSPSLDLLVAHLLIRVQSITPFHAPHHPGKDLGCLQCLRKAEKQVRLQQ